MTDTMTEPTTEEPCPPEDPDPDPTPDPTGEPTPQAITPCSAPCRVAMCGPSSTGATAGIPGTWTPASSKVPIWDDISSGHHPITASPATAWTAGQYVQTATPGTAGRIHWSGTAWVAGVA